MDRLQTSHRRAAAALAIAAGLSWLALGILAPRPLIPIDETRYVGVAWEMWCRGDFVLPVLNDAPYSHKPPLLFWSIHAGWALFGVREWWPHVVSALYALGALALTWRLGRRLWPERPAAASRAAAVLASTSLFLVFSTLVMFEMPLVFASVLALLGIARAGWGRSRSGWALAAFGLGLGILAKGPVVLLHTMPVALLAPLWRRPTGDLPRERGEGQSRTRAWLRWYAGALAALLGGVAIALAWAIPAMRAGGEAYTRDILWGQSAGRVVQSFQHARGLWWYLPLLPALFWPWSFVPAVWRGLARFRRTDLDRGTRFCLVVCVVSFGTLSTISGKQVHYLLPMLPALALLVARRLEAEAGASAVGELRWSDRVPLAILFAIVAVAALALFLGGNRFLAGRLERAGLSGCWIVPAFAALALGGGALLVAPGITRRLSSTAMIALVGIVVACAVEFTALRALQPVFDVREVAEAIRQAQERGAPVAHVGKYHDQFHFAGRLREPLERIWEPDLPRWAEAHPDGVIIDYYREDPPAGYGPPVHSGRYRGLTVGLWSSRVILGGDRSSGADPTIRPRRSQGTEASGERTSRGGGGAGSSGPVHVEAVLPHHREHR